MGISDGGSLGCALEVTPCGRRRKEAGEGEGGVEPFVTSAGGAELSQPADTLVGPRGMPGPCMPLRQSAGVSPRRGATLGKTTPGSETAPGADRVGHLLPYSLPWGEELTEGVWVAHSGSLHSYSFL